MKTLIGIRRQINNKKLKSKFEKLHQTVGNSNVKVYTRKEKDIAVQENITTNENFTNVTDGSCEIIFPNVFYDFITNTLPEETKQTEFKLGIINTIISENQELKKIFSREGYLIFSRNLFNNVYNNYLSPTILKEINSYKTFDFSNEDAEAKVIPVLSSIT